jgi:hypothetical protein
MQDPQLKEDIKFLLSFVPARNTEEVTEGLSPMFYVTNTYAGDVELAKRVGEILRRYDIDPSCFDEDEELEEDN